MERKQERTPVYAGVYEEIAEIIGEERIGEFYERFKGQQFVFPMKLYSKEYVVQEIKRLQGKQKISDMAQLIRLSIQQTILKDMPDMEQMIIRKL